MSVDKSGALLRVDMRFFQKAAVFRYPTQYISRPGNHIYQHLHILGSLTMCRRSCSSWWRIQVIPRSGKGVLRLFFCWSSHRSVGRPALSAGPMPWEHIKESKLLRVVRQQQQYINPKQHKLAKLPWPIPRYPQRMAHEPCTRAHLQKGANYAMFRKLKRH